MKKMISWFTILAFLIGSAFPVSAAVTIDQISNAAPRSIVFAVDDGSLRIQFWSDDIVRVTYAEGVIPSLTSLSVVGIPTATNWTRQESNQDYTFTGPNMAVRIDKESGAVSFLDPAGHVILREADGGRIIAPATQAGIMGTSSTMSFNLSPNEGIYGLGQHQQGVWNWAREGGASVTLAQSNMEVGVPVITSSNGYVLLWDNPAVTTISANDTTAGQGRMHWYSESGKAIDYYLCYNDGTTDTAMKAYRYLTGEAPLMPRWMLGFWQCKERYATQEEMLDVATRYREMEVPVDGIVQDWQYWPSGNNTWGSHKFDPERYPDPAGMFDDLNAMHYHTLISVWPKFDLGSENSNELNEAGGMFEQITRYVYPPGQGQWYNPFAPQGREIYWRQIRDQLFTLGVDGWWLDAPEPEITNMEFRTYNTGIGAGYEMYNAYPLMHSTGIYQGQRATTNEKRVVILTRSAYAGQQRNSAITWSGDIQASWQSFRNQIPAGLNFTLSGIPYWNTDTGGFFGNRSAGNGDATNPAYQEIFARWFQFSAFCPMFRVHGSYGLNPGREIWRFDEKTQQIMYDYLNLRYRLLPYLYSVAWQVTSEGTTFMRPLVMDFPADEEVLDIGGEYLFGPSILVTPVTTAGAVIQSVYLPTNDAPWYNFWTGTAIRGGQYVEAAAPIETMPLFIHSGSIIPLGPYLQYSDEKPADPIELRIYHGADGSFTLYEDEDDSYRYEEGVYSTIPISWDEANQTLTIGERTGAFPGMLEERTFNVVWVSADHGAGIAPTETPDVVVRYNGDIIKVSRDLQGTN